MEASLGSKALAAEYAGEEARLRRTITDLYWDSDKGLVADTPEKTAFSQHANALAILAGVLTGDQAADVVDRIVTNRSIVQCSIYFRHYLHSAVNKAGRGDRYLDLLGPWRAMLAQGLTTWAETEDPTRSDCHAWGASPNFELFRTVLGVDSGSPGFKRVIIRPYLGTLTQVSGSTPHPAGAITVRLVRSGEKLEAEVSIPAGTTGEFVWKGKSGSLNSGETRLSF
jgi:hypothetical protein